MSFWSTRLYSLYSSTMKLHGQYLAWLSAGPAGPNDPKYGLWRLDLVSRKRANSHEVLFFEYFWHISIRIDKWPLFV